MTTVIPVFQYTMLKILSKKNFTQHAEKNSLKRASI